MRIGSDGFPYHDAEVTRIQVRISRIYGVFLFRGSHIGFPGCTGLIEEGDPLADELTTVVVGAATDEVSVHHAGLIHEGAAADLEVETALRDGSHAAPAHAVSIGGNFHPVADASNRFFLGKEMSRDADEILVVADVFRGPSPAEEDAEVVFLPYVTEGHVRLDGISLPLLRNGPPRPDLVEHHLVAPFFRSGDHRLVAALNQAVIGVKGVNGFSGVSDNDEDFGHGGFRMGSDLLETLLEIGAGAVDFSGHPGGGPENGNSAGEGMHEGFGEAREADFLQSSEKGRKIQLTPAGHLEALQLVGLFPVGSLSVLLAVEEGHLASESGNEPALQFGILGKMMRCVGESEGRVSRQFAEYPDSVRGREDLPAVVFHCDGHAVFSGRVSMRLHLFDEARHFLSKVLALGTTVTACTTDNDSATEPPGNWKLGTESERSQLILGEDPEFNPVPGEEFLEGIESHVSHLFAVVGVRPGPDVNVPRPRLAHLGENLGEGGGPIHRGGNEVVQPEGIPLASGAGHSGHRGDLAEAASFHAERKCRAPAPFAESIAQGG